LRRQFIAGIDALAIRNGFRFDQQVNIPTSQCIIDSLAE